MMIPSASSMPMPHLIFQIDEILRLIAKYVGWVSPPAAIEFARCCRAFEEPALRPLWEYTTLRNLMYVLPKDVLHFDCPSTYVGICRQLTPNERWRLFRYASWVRSITGLITEDFVCFLQVLFGLPVDDPFPNLRDIYVWIEPTILPFLHRFVSPHLTLFDLFLDSEGGLGCSEYESLTNTVSAIPGPSLQRFSLRENQWENASLKFKQEVSAMVLRCGTALKYLDSGAELSEQAVLHVIQLPNLYALKLTHESPPNIADIISLQDTIILPSLKSLTLTSPTSHAWLPFINDLLWRHPAATAIRGPGHPQAQIGIHSTLEELYCLCGETPNWPIVKQAFRFKNLTILEVEQQCPVDRCSFDLTDDHVTAIAKALPRIRMLLFGHPCLQNTCQTTFRSLATLSANCVELTDLQIHFNTINIVEDVKSLVTSKDPAIQKLRKGQGCGVGTIPVHLTPLTLDALGVQVLARGFLFVFPGLMSQPIEFITRDAATSAWPSVISEISQLRALNGLTSIPYFTVANTAV